MQGRPAPFVDMRIVDERGAELPRDGKAFGDLQVRGPHVVSRYFRVGHNPLMPFSASSIGELSVGLALADDPS